MDLTRRSLFKGGAAIGAGMLLPVTGSAAANALVPAGVLPFTEPLPTLAQLGVIDATTGVPATLSMVNASHSFHAAMAATPTMAYRASGGTQTYLGRRGPAPGRHTRRAGPLPLGESVGSVTELPQGPVTTVRSTAVSVTASRLWRASGTTRRSPGDPLQMVAPATSRTRPCNTWTVPSPGLS